MKSVLIVIKEEYLSKGIALSLLDQFRSIHTTKNPFEALAILNNQSIDLVITDTVFNTIKSDEYLIKLTEASTAIENIILIKDGKFQFENNFSSSNIFIQAKPVSIKKLLNIIKSFTTKKENEL